MSRRQKCSKRYCIHVTTWYDKTQMLFGHINQVSSSFGGQVKRNMQGKLVRVTLYAPQLQPDYTDNFNSADRNDCQYHPLVLALFFWLFHLVIYVIFVLFVFVLKIKRMVCISATGNFTLIMVLEQSLKSIFG